MKTRTNLSIDQDLLKAAREQGLVLSNVLEEALRQCLRKTEEEAWLAENREAIRSYNQYVDAKGVFSDGIRRF
jgi:antitoxin CcdA